MTNKYIFFSRLNYNSAITHELGSDDERFYITFSVKFPYKFNRDRELSNYTELARQLCDTFLIVAHRQKLVSYFVFSQMTVRDHESKTCEPQEEEHRNVLIRKSSSTMLKWNLDLRPFTIADLVRLSSATLQAHGIDTILNLPSEKNILNDFCTNVAMGYNPELPYHNFKHGFMVMHITNNLLSISSAYATPLLRASLLTASLSHDIFHDGRTNSFHVKTKSSIALLYPDYSTLERMHAAKAVETLQSSGMLNYIGSNQKVRLFKEAVCELILSTDMGSQPQLLRNVVENGTTPLFISKLVIHAADIANPTLSPELSQYWAELVLQEFTQQVEHEEALGIEQTLFLKAKVGTAQEAALHLGFITKFVQPAWEALSTVLPNNNSVIHSCLNSIASNKRYWEARRAHLNN